MNILNMFGIIDVLIVLIVFGLIFLGWKSGFLLKIIKLASSLFGLIASLLLAKPFSMVLDKWFGEGIYQRIEAFLIEKVANGNVNATEEIIRESLSEMAMPKFIVDWIVESASNEGAAISFIDSVTPLIKSLILLLIAFVVLFFGSMLVFLLLKILAKMVTSIPIIKQVDKVLGALFGLFKAAVLIFVLLFILGLLITIPSVNDLIGDFLTIDMQLETDSFRLSKWLYDNNVLKYIVFIFATIL
ncbi:MAG: CvpA family protein [Candidatus Izemoplasmatales bacterium]